MRNTSQPCLRHIQYIHQDGRLHSEVFEMIGLDTVENMWVMFGENRSEPTLSYCDEKGMPVIFDATHKIDDMAVKALEFGYQSAVEFFKKLNIKPSRYEGNIPQRPHELRVVMNTVPLDDDLLDRLNILCKPSRENHEVYLQSQILFNEIADSMA